MSTDDPVADAERALRICTACMYCDGLCPVFAAIDGKHGFSRADLSYLANLCHNCRGCWYACQYAPPHPFAVNLPATLAELRRRSYVDRLWPPQLGRAIGAPGLVAAIMVALGVMVTIAAVLIAAPPGALFAADSRESAFYRVMPWPMMAGLAGASFLWAVIGVTLATMRFWRAIAPRASSVEILRALAPALRDIVTLRHLGGGGPGCHDDGERTSQRRRILHHFTAGGFLLCAASTVVAAGYHHWFQLAAPYPVTSLPVLLGLAGGMAMTTGTGGLLWLACRGDREPSDRREAGLNLVLLILLALVGVSGLALLAWRSTPAMGVLLALHLGIVFGFFAALPFTKALHAPFRAAALLRAAIEQRRKPDAT